MKSTLIKPKTKKYEFYGKWRADECDSKGRKKQILF